MIEICTVDLIAWFWFLNSIFNFRLFDDPFYGILSFDLILCLGSNEALYKVFIDFGKRVVELAYAYFKCRYIQECPTSCRSHERDVKSRNRGYQAWTQGLKIYIIRAIFIGDRIVTVSTTYATYCVMPSKATPSQQIWCQKAGWNICSLPLFCELSPAKYQDF